MAVTEAKAAYAEYYRNKLLRDLIEAERLAQIARVNHCLEAWMAFNATQTIVLN